MEEHSVEPMRPAVLLLARHAEWTAENGLSVQGGAISSVAIDPKTGFAAFTVVVLTQREVFDRVGDLRIKSDFFDADRQPAMQTLAGTTHAFSRKGLLVATFHIRCPIPGDYEVSVDLEDRFLVRAPIEILRSE